MKRSSAAGVIAATVFAMLALACAGFGLLVASHMAAEEKANRQVDAMIQESKQLTEAAKRAARPLLARHGIMEFSNDTSAGPYNGDVVLVGTGRGATDKLRKFVVRFHVATFGRERKWEVRSVVIDGNEVFTTE